MRGRSLARRLGDGEETHVFGALETREHGEPYDWRGLQRGIDPSHPRLLFQYTLDGWGEYSEPGMSPVRVDSGKAFCVILPSDHRYCLPSASRTWTFLWAMVSHPYVVSRVVALRRSLPAVIDANGDSAVIGRLVRLVEAAYGSARDAPAMESAIFDFYFEYERHASALLHPAAQREKLLADVRDVLRRNLDERIDVETIADHYGMSRSHFAHHFKAVTGLAPAHYLTVLRLEEAADRLSDPQLTLDAVASQTGFANANHFCKVFRRHFYISPGEYRRQIR